MTKLLASVEPLNEMIALALNVSPLAIFTRSESVSINPASSFNPAPSFAKMLSRPESVRGPVSP